MRNIIQKIEDMAVATAFAEAGEDGMALELSPLESRPAGPRATGKTAELGRGRITSRNLASSGRYSMRTMIEEIEDAAAAIAFAEAGEGDTALELLRRDSHLAGPKAVGRIAGLRQEKGSSRELPRVEDMP